MKHKVKNSVIRIVLSVLVLALFPVMNLLTTANELDYQLYFSEERELVNSPTLEINASWVGYPFIVNNDNLQKIHQDYPETSDKICVGSVYQERLVNEEVVLVPIVIGNFDYYGISGTLMYLSDGEKLFSFDLNTNALKTIFNATANIKNIWAYDEVVFFQANEKIYRYHVKSSITDLVLENANLESFRPWSNQTIHYSTSNPDYDLAVMASGTSIHEKVSDPVFYSNWINQYFGLNTDPNSKPFQECDVESILAACGIEAMTSYFYNIENAEILSDYSVGEPSRAANNNGLIAPSQGVSSPEVSLYGAVNPSTAYSTNQFFSDSKYYACTCHNGNCSYVDSGCDCKVFDGGIQCEGYARYLFYQTSGVHYGSGVNSTSSLPAPTTPASTTFFPTIHLPAILRTTTIYGGSHTILIYYADSTTIKICEANTSRDSTLSNNNCRVYNFQSLTYYEFANRYQSYNELITAPHNLNNSSWSANATTHWKVCPCGMQMSIPVSHTIGSDGYCIVCGRLSALNTRTVNNKINSNSKLSTLA